MFKMKNYIKIFVLLIICFGLTSVKTKHDLTVDWNKITEKEYVIKYVKITDDTTATKVTNGKKAFYYLDENAKKLSEKTVKLLQKFILNSNNFGDEIEDPECKMISVKNAFLVLRKGNLEGRINIACDGNFWVFEPKTKHVISVLVSEAGKKMKDKIFSELQ